MHKVGDKVVISDIHAHGRDGDDGFIRLNSGIYWWHGVITDTDVQIKGWENTQLIRVKYGNRESNFLSGQVHSVEYGIECANRKDILERLAERRTPIQKRVARYTFNMSTEKMYEKLQSLVTRIQHAGMLEQRNVELVQEYEALSDVYRRRSRR